MGMGKFVNTGWLSSFEVDNAVLIFGYQAAYHPIKQKSQVLSISNRFLFLLS